MNPPSHRIIIEDLGLRLGSKTIYRHLNLRIPRQGLSVLMGPGGAGKSTLLHLLIGHHDGDHVDRQGQIQLFADRPGEKPRVLLMRQKPVLIVSPAIEWLRQCHLRRGELSPLDLRRDIEAFLTHLGLTYIRDRLDERAVEWSVGHRRALLLTGYLLMAPDLLCLDEPFVDLDDDEAEPLLQLLESQKAHQTILLVTHHQRRARRLGDQISLLAGGQILETAPTDLFFDEPQHSAAQAFVRTGSCYVPSPDTPPEHLADDLSLQAPVVRSPLAPSPKPTSPKPTSPSAPLSTGYKTDKTRPDLDTTWIHTLHNVDQPAPLTLRRQPFESAHRGPSEFHWIWPGLLAGTARPGLFNSLETDLEALLRVGIKALVTLNETPLDSARVQAMGIHHLHLPIVDMTPPSQADALHAVRWANAHLKEGRPVAYHCRAGIGRTGTLLAAQLIATFPAHGPDALPTIRKVFPRYVQSSEQERFLADFAKSLAAPIPAT